MTVEELPRALAPVADEVLARLAGRRGIAADATVVVGISGGVAAGKTVTADALASLLVEQEGLEVAVVSSDGFLWSNAELDRDRIVPSHIGRTGARTEKATGAQDKSYIDPVIARVEISVRK